MTKLADGTHLYPVMDRKKYGERPGFKITELCLDAEQMIPWHKHSAVSDTFYVIEGLLRVLVHEPEEEVLLEPRHTFQVAAGRAHQVTNGGKDPVRFIVIGDAQGEGPYDFEPIIN